MNNGFYTNIGYIVVWCIKYIFVPFGVAVSATVVAYKLLQLQPEGQRKNGLKRTVFRISQT